MSKLPEPVKVSPLIKFFRYSFLIAGIIYGAARNKALKIKEESTREERERRKAEREAKILEEKQAATERDIAELISIFTPKSVPKVKVEEQEYKADVKDANEFVGMCKVGEVTPKIKDNLDDLEPTYQCPSNVEYNDIKGKNNENTTSASDEVKQQNNKDSLENSTDSVKQSHIFSQSLNLNDADDDKGNVEKYTKISTNSNDVKTKVDNTEQSDANGYFVQSFSDEIPYVTTEERTEIFYPPKETKE